jgi:hypothetical protein
MPAPSTPTFATFASAMPAGRLARAEISLTCL